MSKKDWKMVLGPDSDANIPIVDDGEIASTLQLLFGPDSQVRKEWLQNND